MTRGGGAPSPPGNPAGPGAAPAALHRLQRAEIPKRTGDVLDQRWEHEHGRLHSVLLSACGSPLLLRFHAMLFEQSERYRRLAVAYGQPRRDIAAEHAALARAALARDAERACALLVEHIAATTERVLAGHPAFTAR